ncbi:pentapeptide repeat-containing protein [Nonomuraea sp. NPDC050394]|uniref:pentapeptide repeat-containing protein n=1 Tax=Nonomuraea sp. NPDC050394 TaxID=3364363 RepID=UPI0037B4E4EC
MPRHQMGGHVPALEVVAAATSAKARRIARAEPLATPAAGDTTKHGGLRVTPPTHAEYDALPADRRMELAEARRQRPWQHFTAIGVVVAKDSPADATTIEDVVVAFILEHDYQPTKTAPHPPESGWQPGPDEAHAVRVLGKVLDGSSGYRSLRSAQLAGVRWGGADLTGSHLPHADLYKGDLSSANLHSANLIGANLHKADLYGADLSSADLSGADLRGVRGMTEQQIRAVAKVDATTTF